MGQTKKKEKAPMADAEQEVLQALNLAAERSSRVAALDAAHQPQLPEDHPEEQETEKPRHNIYICSFAENIIDCIYRYRFSIL